MHSTSGSRVRAQRNPSGSGVREATHRALQHGHLGGVGAASARVLRVVRRCWRCVSFWVACVMLRSSALRARLLRVRSGLVVMAALLGCVVSLSVWVGDAPRAGGWLSGLRGDVVFW